ncbi:MAG: hypothetical protein AB7G23_14990 [Vicinamibacterales bacterium]
MPCFRLIVVAVLLSLTTAVTPARATVISIVTHGRGPTQDYAVVGDIVSVDIVASDIGPGEAFIYFYFKLNWRLDPADRRIAALTLHAFDLDPAGGQRRS